MELTLSLKVHRMKYLSYEFSSKCVFPNLVLLNSGCGLSSGVYGNQLQMYGYFLLNIGNLSSSFMFSVCKYSAIRCTLVLVENLCGKLLFLKRNNVPYNQKIAVNKL